MGQESPLQTLRLHFKPAIPRALLSLNECVFESAGEELKDKISSSILEKFPHLSKSHLLRLKQARDSSKIPLKVGVVFSGGPAPGGHNVIAGLFTALKQISEESRLIGFLDGPSGILENRWIEIGKEIVDKYLNQGGFDMIGSGRTKIETEEQFALCREVAAKNKLDGLVIIGGDDSNTNAALLAEHFFKHKVPCSVVGVPKTIDGDLKNSYIETSFGFDSATKTYSESIGNLLKDALSQGKYTFFIKIMGRSASHIALECALKTHPNLTLIGEEILENKWTLLKLINEIADLIARRSQEGKNYGAVVIPEGIIEFIPEFKGLIKALNQLHAAESSLKENKLSPEDKLAFISKSLDGSSKEIFDLLPGEIRKQLILDRDPHGNIQVSKIETERLLIELVQQELKKREAESGKKIKFSPQGIFLGYEGRSCLPSNFDCCYTFSLGIVAALLIREKASGYMACIQNLAQPVEEWHALGVPLILMMHMEERGGAVKPVLEKKLVDLKGAAFMVFKNKRQSWSLQDCYLCPGSIQYFGPKELTDAVSLTLKLESDASP